MQAILIILFAYHLQAQSTPISKGPTTSQSVLGSSPVSNLVTNKYSPPTFPSNPGSPIINSNQAASNSVFSATFPVKITMPVRIPSPSNDPIYYLFQNAFTSYHALIYQKQQPCKTTNMIKNLTIRQHNTTYYLTSEQYFLSFRNELTKAPQFFSATQNIDCSWTFKSVQGLYVSLKSQYTYLMLQPNITATEQFNFQQKNDYFYIQSANQTSYYWTAIKGIGRLGKKQGSRLILQVWP